jgi:hypothetical protein
VHLAGDNSRLYFYQEADGSREVPMAAADSPWRFAEAKTETGA